MDDRASGIYEIPASNYKEESSQELNVDDDGAYEIKSDEEEEVIYSIGDDDGYEIKSDKDEEVIYSRYESDEDDEAIYSTTDDLVLSTNDQTDGSTITDPKSNAIGATTACRSVTTLFSAKSQPQLFDGSLYDKTKEVYMYDSMWSKRLLQDNKLSSSKHHLIPKSNSKDLDVLRGRKRIKVTTLKDLSEGDAIAFVRVGGLYKHHAIVESINLPLQRLKIVELSGESGDLLAFSSSVGPKANVAIKALEFKHCRHIYRYRYDLVRSDKIHPTDVAKLLFDIGLPQDYTFFKFNCEHFVSYCITGIPFSKQTDKITTSINEKAKLLLDKHVRNHIDCIPNRKPPLPSRPECFVASDSKNIYLRRKYETQTSYYDYEPLNEPEPDYPGYLEPSRPRHLSEDTECYSQLCNEFFLY